MTKFQQYVVGWLKRKNAKVGRLVELFLHYTLRVGRISAYSLCMVFKEDSRTTTSYKSLVLHDLFHVLLVMVK